MECRFVDLGYSSDAVDPVLSAAAFDSHSLLAASLVGFRWSLLWIPIATFMEIETPNRLTMRWSERRTALRPTFEMISTLPLRSPRALVRRRSSCSR